MTTTSELVCVTFSMYSYVQYAHNILYGWACVLVQLFYLYIYLYIFRCCCNFTVYTLYGVNAIISNLCARMYVRKLCNVVTIRTFTSKFVINFSHWNQRTHTHTHSLIPHNRIGIVSILWCTPGCECEWNRFDYQMYTQRYNL